MHTVLHLPGEEDSSSSVFRACVYSHLHMPMCVRTDLLPQEGHIQVPFACHMVGHATPLQSAKSKRKAFAGGLQEPAVII